MLEQIRPMDIERRSFEIITELLGDRKLDPENELVIKRAIHTTADFEYADNLVFSAGAVEAGVAAIRQGCTIVTDTQMAFSGVNKRVLESLIKSGSFDRLVSLFIETLEGIKDML